MGEPVESLDFGYGVGNRGSMPPLATPDFCSGLGAGLEASASTWRAGELLVGVLGCAELHDSSDDILMECGGLRVTLRDQARTT